MERPSESTLHSNQAAYETAKQSGTGKTLKKVRFTLLETLTLHRLEEEYYYIIGGEKGPPPKVPETVPMEVCSEAGAAASQGGGDAPLSHKHVSWEEQVQDEEEWVSTEAPRRELPLPPQQGTASISTSSVIPSTDDDGSTPVRGWKSQDKRPRDPSKDPTPRQRPSKASQSPLPFPLRSEAERVANVHTIFETALNQTRPSSKWVYDHLETYFPCKSKEQLVYFSNVLCLAIAEFHLTSGCTPMGMCSPVLPPIVEMELPPLEMYLHDRELGTQDVCILSEAAIKWLGVWLQWVDMTVRYNEARANSPCDSDHKLGTLLNYFLMPENTGVSLEHIISQVVAENMDALEVCLVKSKKVLKEASKMQSKLLTRVAKQKLALEKGHPTEAAHEEAARALCQTTEQLEWARSPVVKHTADIAHIKALLEDCESTDEESSSSGDSSPLESGSGDPSTVTPQGQEEEHDIEMRDDGDDPNPPQGMATQTNPLPEATGDDSKSEKDVIIEEERIITEGGGVTPITPADDQLLDQDDQEDRTGAKTPSGVVTESLSQMNMCPPHPHLWWVIPLVVTRKLKRSPRLQVTNLTQPESQFTESCKLLTEAGAPASCQTDKAKKRSGTWPDYNDSLYRIIQEIFINSIFVKLVDQSPLRWPHLLYLFHGWLL